MTDLRTDEGLLQALKSASSRTPSFEQLERQRLSFVMGALPDDNNMTRDEVQSVIEQQEGRRLILG